MAAQVPDNILVEHEAKDLLTNPLEQYWTLHKKKRPAFCSTEACRRGYVATWVIYNQQLFLKSIEGEVRQSIVLFGPKTKQFTVKKLFPRAGNQEVKAAWFTGRLRIPLGSMTRFEDHEYDSRFEQDMIITVNRGNVTRTVTLNNSEHALIVHDVL